MEVLIPGHWCCNLRACLLVYFHWEHSSFWLFLKWFNLTFTAHCSSLFSGHNDNWCHDEYRWQYSLLTDVDVYGGPSSMSLAIQLLTALASLSSSFAKLVPSFLHFLWQRFGWILFMSSAKLVAIMRVGRTFWFFRIDMTFHVLCSLIFPLQS